MKFSKLLSATLAAGFLAVSCSDDDAVTPTKYVPLGKYDSGVLVLNQGGFGHDDASLSYISFDFTKLENDIFSLANPEVVLGDTAQDIAFNGQFAYVILNGSNTIQIVNRYTMKHIGTIDTGLSNPRYMAIYNNKGYVTNWGDGVNTGDDYVAVINLATRTVTSSIPVTEGPERILEHNGKLYVAHMGGYGFGNKISVIKTSDSSVSTITVGDVPNAMQLNGNDLWVSYGGKPSFSGAQSAGGLVKINTASDAVEHAYAYTAVTTHPQNLVIDGNFAYYTIDSGVYKYQLDNASLPTTAAFTTTDQGVYGVYTMAIRQHNLYVADAGNYIDPGKVHIYSLGTAVGQSALGTLEESFTVGIIPAGFYFNF
jgi:YVTN family beta-propeller protein